MEPSSTSAPLCQDEEYNTFMTPRILSLQTFFVTKEHYSFYPFALSAIGALRYGANSVVTNEKRHVMDHDVDFLISPQSDRIEMNKTTVDSLFGRLVQHLSEDQIFVAKYFCTEQDIFNMAAHQLMAKDIGVDFYPGTSQDESGRNYTVNAMRLATPPNDLTKKLEHEGVEIAFEWLKRSLPASKMKDLQRSKDFVEKFVLPNIAPREPNMWTEFDFFFSPDVNQEEFRASESKKIMFYGVTMQYPLRDHVIMIGFQSSAWDADSRYARVAREGNVCNFHVPDAVFQADVPAVSEEFELVRYCSRALSEHGYQSLAHCF